MSSQDAAGEEYQRWLQQAQSDLTNAHANSERGAYDVCCFLCALAAELAVKSVYVVKMGRPAPWTHNIGDLAASRYPDLLAEIPARAYTSADAHERLRLGEMVVAWAREQHE